MKFKYRDVLFSDAVFWAKHLETYEKSYLENLQYFFSRGELESVKGSALFRCERYFKEEFFNFMEDILSFFKGDSTFEQFFNLLSSEAIQSFRIYQDDFVNGDQGSLYELGLIYEQNSQFFENSNIKSFACFKLDYERTKSRRSFDKLIANIDWNDEERILFIENAPFELNECEKKILNYLKKVHINLHEYKHLEETSFHIIRGKNDLFVSRKNNFINYFADKAEIKEMVEKRNIKYLLHFTNKYNVQNILKYGICSRNYIKKNTDIDDYYITDLDRYDGDYDAVSLSITDINNKMFNQKKEQNIIAEPVAIVIDPSVLFNEKSKCRFYRDNASSRDALEFSGFTSKHLEKMFSNNYCRIDFFGNVHYFSRYDKESDQPTNNQSEIQIRNCIPVEFIKGIVDLKTGEIIYKKDNDFIPGICMISNADQLKSTYFNTQAGL